MTRRASVERRTERLAVAMTARHLQREVVHWAAGRGIETEELLAEAEALAVRCRAVGATTLPAMAAVVAEEGGLDPDEVLAEAEVLARAAGMDTNGRTA